MCYNDTHQPSTETTNNNTDINNTNNNKLLLQCVRSDTVNGHTEKYIKKKINKYPSIVITLYVYSHDYFSIQYTL